MVLNLMTMDIIIYTFFYNSYNYSHFIHNITHHIEKEKKNYIIMYYFFNDIILLFKYFYIFFY